MAKILWMDNDRTQLIFHEKRLRVEGHEVVRAYTLTETEQLLSGSKDWDLVLIDIMMNVRDEEENDYPPSKADGGHKAGMHFYERNRSRIEEIKAKVAVLTVRGESDIPKWFEGRGVPKENFRVKSRLLGDVAIFDEWIGKVLASGQAHVS